MRTEIKQRIELIQRSEVPNGYKKTRVGIIPTDWNVGTIGECILEYKELSNNIKNIPVYSSSRKGLVPQSQYYTQKEAIKTNLGYKIVPQGYVTYRHMSDDDIFHFNINDTGSKILVSSEYPVFTSSRKAVLKFLISALNETGHFRFFCRAQKLGGTRTRLYLKNFVKYKLALPSFTEQQKIAEILTSCDRVIELKEKLLAEKRQQKKYLMQQLLTGKKRLNGYTDEWKTVKLKNVLKERKTYSRKGMKYPHVTLSTEGIYPKNERYDRDHLVKSSEKEYKITHLNDICYNPANLKFGVICVNRYGDAIFSPIYVTFEIKSDRVLLGFLSYYIMRRDFINAVLKYQEGTVYERMAVKPKDFLKSKIELPPIKEQIAISSIFKTADREIELLQRDLEHWKQKKKVLMQLLLTGIVRVSL